LFQALRAALHAFAATPRASSVASVALDVLEVVKSHVIADELPQSRDASTPYVHRANEVKVLPTDEAKRSVGDDAKARGSEAKRSEATDAGQTKLLMFEMLLLLLRVSKDHTSDAVYLTVCASVTSFVNIFREFLFLSSAPHCAQLCREVLTLCASERPSIRFKAAALMYVMIRANVSFNGNFARIKVDASNALSRIISEDGLTSDKDIKRALALIAELAAGDADAPKLRGGVFDARVFAADVADLVATLSSLLRDTLTLREEQSASADVDALASLHYTIARSFKHSLNLRVVWLENLARLLEASELLPEAACVVLETAHQVADILGLKDLLRRGELFLESISTVAPGFDTAQLTAPMRSEIESSPFFKPEFVTGALQRGISLLERCGLYEVAVAVYKRLVFTMEAQKDWKGLADAYGHMQKVGGGGVNPDGAALRGGHRRQRRAVARGRGVL
jgi:hypothetical protein